MKQLKFKDRFIPMILEGTKTQTRRIWEDPLAEPRISDGDVVAVVDEAGEIRGHIEIREASFGRMFDMHGYDLVEEGYPNHWKDFNTFWDDWMECYPALIVAGEENESATIAQS